MPPTVADLVKVYPDTPPPKKESLSELKGRLEVLSGVGYQSPLLVKPYFFKSLGIESPQAAISRTFGGYASVADLGLPFRRAIGPSTFKVATLSEILGSSYRPSMPLFGAAKNLYGSGNLLGKTMKAWGLQSLEHRLQRWIDALRVRPPFMYVALDAWEAFLEGDIEALDRFIMEHLQRQPDNTIRLAVQDRLERAFGTEGLSVPEWASDPSGFDVAVFRRVKRQVRDEEKATINEIRRLQEAGVADVRMGLQEGLRLRKVMAQDLGLDHKHLWVTNKLKDHYVQERFPGAVLVARAENPHLPETPARKREPNLRSHTATSVEQEAAEGLIRERVIGRPLEANEYGDLVVPFDPKEDRGAPPSVVTPLSEDSHIERWEAQERERGRVNLLHEAMHRAGLSPGEEEVVRMKWVEGLGNKDIAAKLGRSASQVGVEAYRGLQKVRDAARG